MKNSALFVAVLGLACLHLQAQEKRGPSTEEERTHALTLIDDLESNPLGTNAKEERRWLTIWLIEVPDIHVSFCTALLPNLSRGSKKDSDIVETQLMFSGARYAIQHREDSASLMEQYQTGMEGTLKTYQALLRDRPGDREPKLDDLVARRDAGTLAEYVRQQASHCKK